VGVGELLEQRRDQFVQHQIGDLLGEFDVRGRRR
jgi:hypothetical protein